MAHLSKMRGSNVEPNEGPRGRAGGLKPSIFNTDVHSNDVV